MHRDIPLISRCHSDVRRKSDPRCTASMHRDAPSDAPLSSPPFAAPLGWNQPKEVYVLDLPMFDAVFIPDLATSEAESEKLNDLRCSTQISSQGTKFASTILLDNKHRGLGRGSEPVDLQRAAKRRQARQGERACTQGARRPEGRSPSTGDDGSHPRHLHRAHHQQHRQQRDRIRVRARAHGAGGLALPGIVETRAGRRATSASGISGIAPPRLLAGGGAPCAKWFDAPAAKRAPARLPAPLRPRMPPGFGKYLSPGRRHASAMGPVNLRIWVGGKPALVCDAMGR